MHTAITCDSVPATLLHAPDFADIPQRDIVSILLKRSDSDQTRRAYTTDLKAFFGGYPTIEDVAAFVRADRAYQMDRITTHLSDLATKGLGRATINRRLAAINSLINVGYEMRIAQHDARGLARAKHSESYRDTRGIGLPMMRELLAQPARIYGEGSLQALRDTALLRLMYQLGLRLNEIVTLRVCHFSSADLRLMVMRKGDGGERKPITITCRLANSIQEYLDASGHDEGALWRSCDRRPAYRGKPITADGLHAMVRNYGRRIGVKLSPHRMRHTSITRAAVVTNGNIVAMQAHSGHRDVRVLQRYIDNQQDWQGGVGQLLEDETI